LLDGVRRWPGSASWTSAVRDVVISEFDTDRSGDLDTLPQIDAVPCVVWSAVTATYPGFLSGLGFVGERRYTGDRIGIREAIVHAATTRILSCRW
jgi:hypothetical protein